MCMCGILPMIHSFRIPKVEATGLEIWAVYLAKTLQESAPEADLDRCGASNRNQIPFQKKIHSLLVDHFRSFFSWSHPKKGWLSANRFMVPKLLILGRLKGVPRNYPALRTEPTPQEAHSGLRPWTHPWGGGSPELKEAWTQNAPSAPPAQSTSGHISQG